MRLGVRCQLHAVGSADGLNTGGGGGVCVPWTGRHGNMEGGAHFYACQAIHLHGKGDLIQDMSYFGTSADRQDVTPPRACLHCTAGRHAITYSFCLPSTLCSHCFVRGASDPGLVASCHTGHLHMCDQSSSGPRLQVPASVCHYTPPLA